jgi:hypothetical protein
MWEDAEALLMAFEAEHEAIKAGHPFSRLRVSEASRALAIPSFFEIKESGEA